LALENNMPEAEIKVRLDQHVLSRYPSLSRSYVARLIDEGKVLVNDETSKPGYRLRSADKVKIDFDLAELEQIPDINLPILYEDKDVLVINKPVGVISHSRGRYWYEPSVASFVRQKTGQEGDRSGIVHRLDRATSGVMICAKNQETLSWLQKQFSHRKVKKTYIAIVTGQPELDEAVIDMPIERHPRRPQTFRVASAGRPAVTKYKVTKRLSAHSVMELTPETGRTHQLRVHLKRLGHSIVGDTLYDGQQADRLYLHAASLGITLPSGKREVFSAPLPKEFKTFISSHA